MSGGGQRLLLDRPWALRPGSGPVRRVSPPLMAPAALNVDQHLHDGVMATVGYRFTALPTIHSMTYCLTCASSELMEDIILRTLHSSWALHIEYIKVSTHRGADILEGLSRTKRRGEKNWQHFNDRRTLWSLS